MDDSKEYKTLPNGIKTWHRHGNLHRDNRPAVIWPNGKEEWFRDGRRHREDGPAIISSNGNISWYLGNRSYRFSKWIELTSATNDIKIALKLEHG